MGFTKIGKPNMPNVQKSLIPSRILPLLLSVLKSRQLKN